MNKKLPYSKQRLPDLITSLKSQVTKNLEIVNKDVERDLSSDKFFNVLKGRRMAAELAISSMNAIDKIEQDLGIESSESYFNANLPILIEHLKEMFDINLKVVDIDIDDEDMDDNLRDTIKPDLEQMFGKDITRKILKKIGPGDGLSEDKYANVIKAREKAVEDNQWVLGIIDELEAKLNKEDLETNKPKSWALESVES